MIIKKRQLVLATLVLALSAAVFINWYYTRPEIEQASGTAAVTDVSASPTDSLDTDGNLGEAHYVNTDTTESKEEYFANIEIRRSKAHDEALETLEKIIKDSNSSKSAVEEASSQLNKLSASIKLESDIEALIAAKLGLDSVVIVNGEKCEVVVENGKLDSTGVLQIKELSTKQTNFPAENITIIELNG